MRVRITKAGLFGSTAYPVDEIFKLGETPGEHWFSYFDVLEDDGSDLIVNPSDLDPDAPGQDAPKLDDMTIPELLELAELNAIDIGDAKKKADILAAIELALSPA